MKNTLLGISVVSAVLLILLAIAFPDVFFHPNGYLFGEGVDAFKSYFNFAYHLRYGDGLRLEGVNYPFGDHLFYTNSHPLYQLLLDPLEKILPIGKYGPAIMNVGMFSSILIGGSFLFLILRKLSLPLWYAIILAILIQGMYPQFARLYGHFEMTLAYAFPVFWYLLLLFFEGKKQNLLTVSIVFWSTFMGMIGAYLVAINSVFALALLLVLSIVNRRRLKSFLPIALKLLAIALIPLFFIKGFVSLTDWITDRPTNPWGFYVFHANPVSLFMPHFEPLKNMILRWGVSMRHNPEGRAYLGIVVAFFYLTLPLFFILRALLNKEVNFSSFFPVKKLNPFIFASGIVLIYSMCIPFKWGLQEITDAFPIFKQFRALGRFAWPFYYVNAVFLASYVYLLYRKQRIEGRVKLATGFLVIVLTVWTFESCYYIHRLSLKTAIQKNDLLAKDDKPYIVKLEKAGYEAQDFQAIFSIPFASTNGDKMLFLEGADYFRYAQSYAYHLNIPLIQSFSPRLSFFGALTSAQLLADPLIAKERLQFLNEKPILVIESAPPVNEKEVSFLASSRAFYKDEQVTLRCLYPSALKEAHDLKIKEFHTLISGLSINEPISLSNQVYFYQGFDEEVGSPPEVFSGAGAFDGPAGDHFLYDDFLKDNGFHGRIEISLWLYINDDHHDMPKAYLDIFDRNGEKREAKIIETRAEHNIVERWVRCELELEVESDMRYRLRLSEHRLTCDDLLIRQLDDDIIVPTEFGYLWNNFPIYQTELEKAQQ